MHVSLNVFNDQSQVSRTFLVDSSFGKKDFVKNTTSQQAFSKKIIKAWNLRSSLSKTQKTFAKRLQLRRRFRQTVLLQTQTRKLSGHRSMVNG